uniref:Uncharacterized protein n=1 Tax=Anguilla anguilla TaxID=7936 RepID=A0A0E9REU1_ANGAN
MLMTVKSGQEAFSALQLAASASRFGHIASNVEHIHKQSYGTIT